ncbi:signal peptidase I . Serine peptidase. MEROPS family S26A [Carboxydocella sporoproducens DSM 16521]|uniref:Signal peptidase I n=2 Tax=Carboxydocella TaxID=178898 RepID=A0A1T4PXN7_9FIRM|nr:MULTISPECIES: signal peptidase I [Carboxydocella]AVX20490.1 signal peptidase I Serine peptidase [Carboxydocella thermautotrophica]AVX30911.1 signal peptidase I / Serine peptidase, MEROPS family S26A [Carboxydocella thermautotrophica]GAW29693.1 signal peptidase I [Carboxydocella sp. ULO1]SJZ96330.1 signal peptidase I . Serine peptidase. MEROPS family S26A [Carboxydocella sporoproducens DSM 16521]
MVENTEKKEGLWELLEALAIAVVLAAIIRFFVVQPFYIPSGSMEPTLKPGDRIIVNKFIYRFTKPQRGDIMVFKFPLDPKRDFIKRVIGLPGDIVEIKDSNLYINGKQIKEPYLPPGLRFQDFGPVKVPDDHYFMMGDNRNHSDDSRFWGFLPQDNIVGKAMVIYWPLSRIGIIDDYHD